MKFVVVVFLALAACAPAPTELPEDFDSSFEF
jgi:hypothetical protein